MPSAVIEVIVKQVVVAIQSEDTAQAPGYATTASVAAAVADEASRAEGAEEALANGKQALDSDLTAIAGLTPANDDVLQRKSGAWTNRSIAQLKPDLDITSITGQYLGSASTFAGLQTTDAVGNAASNGDWAVLNTDLVGTGKTANPQYPEASISTTGLRTAWRC